MVENDNSEEMSDELTAKLIHFHDVTQIENLDQCKTILENHNWNIEQAVQSTFNDINEPFSAATSTPTQVTTSYSASAIDSGLRRRVISPPHSLIHQHTVMPPPMVYFGGRPRPPPSGIFGWFNYLFFLPIQYTFNQFFSVVKFVFRIFFPDPRERVTDPLGDVTSFIHEFQQKYPNPPQFFRGTYGRAKEEAKKEIQFLLIYLHDPDNEDTDAFCQGTLCHPQSVEFINRKVILWGCSIAKPEGFRVAKIIRNSTYPLLALTCLFNNQMTVVGRLQGQITSEELIGRLTEMIGVYEPTLISLRADKDARNQNILIRKEQDEAYQLSLQKDKEKMDKKLKEEEEARLLQEKKEQRKREKELKKELCLQRRALCKKAQRPLLVDCTKPDISLEKAKDTFGALEGRALIKRRRTNKNQKEQKMISEPDGTSTNIFDLVIKLPNGTRLRRKFRATDTVKTLHDFVYAQDDAPSSFQVFSNFPRRPLPGCCTDTVFGDDGRFSSLQDVGLNRNDTLFVQIVLTDDEDSGDESGLEEESRR